MTGINTFTVQGVSASPDVQPTCPLCHTADATMSTAALLAGGYWKCGRCGQKWDALRLQTAADYATASRN